MMAKGGEKTPGQPAPKAKRRRQRREQNPDTRTSKPRAPDAVKDSVNRVAAPGLSFGSARLPGSSN